MDSILLQKQVRDNAKDLQDFCKELKEWGDEIKMKDESLKRSPNNQSEVPFPRNKVSKISEFNNETNDVKVNTKQNKRIKGCDYAAWEKFDADGYCAKLDKEDADECSSAESELSDEIDESAIDLANSQKEKGNAFVKEQKWTRAIECYTKAIECYAYDPIYYANRALCFLKMKDYQRAESDCTTALQLDKTYVKAYQRRAVARENLNQLVEAQADLLRVLELEPKNKESRAVLIRVEKKMEVTKQKKTEIELPQRPVSKFTLSRKKHDIAELQTQHEGPKKEAPPVSEHIIERIAPTKITESSMASTSTAAISDKAGSSDIGYWDRMTIGNFSSPAPEKMFSGHYVKDIELLSSVYKSPKTRSKKPLKRIEVVEVDIDTQRKFLFREPKNVPKGNEDVVPDKVIVENESDTYKNSALDIKTVEEPRIVEKGSSFDHLNLSCPKSAVQFYNSWKNISSNKEWKKVYLQKINPCDLSQIFKESLESKIFSEIIEVLDDYCHENVKFVYDFLLGLSHVKRFSTIVMFMSTVDKKNLLNIIDFLKQDKYAAAADVDDLIRMYEL